MELGIILLRLSAKVVFPTPILPEITLFKEHLNTLLNFIHCTILIKKNGDRNIRKIFWNLVR